MQYFFRGSLVVIASVVIMLAWLRPKEERSQKIDDLPVSTTCWSVTSAILSGEFNWLLLMEALDNACYGSWRPLTNLMQTF